MSSRILIRNPRVDNVFTFTSKRKADNSPIKNERVKRSALGNLTNANLAQSDSDEIKKGATAAPASKKGSQLENVASRTRAAAKVQTRASVKQKVAKATADLFAAPQHKPEKNSKSKPNEVSVITTAVSSKQQVPDGQIKASRRISNEFEKTEESLYVSALEDISDASRFYDARLNKQDSSDSSLGDRTLSSVSSSDSSPCEAQRLNERVETPLPAGVEDFDKENWNDPFQVSHYARDIFYYLKQREQDYKIRDYMCDQPELSKWMRSLLIDWMVEVQESFELNHETLYLAVKIVDTYLGKERVVKDNLQLLGAASLLIACKYDVSWP